MKKAALYTRVSTNHQIDKDSLPYQKQELIKYAHYLLGVDDYEVFEDAGFSGKNTERPKYQEMMNRIRLGEFSHLVVYKIDRISRNLLDFANMYEELKRLDVAFVSRNEQFDTSSAMGEAMLKIILVFAELERNVTSERVTAIMLDRAEQGKWNGANVPLGYVWSKENQFPVIDESEAKIVHMIFDMYEAGSSFLKIAMLLNENQIKTKRGGTWTNATIRQIIANPFYKGTLRYNYRNAARGKIKQKKEWIIRDNNHSPIIDPTQWDRVQEIRDQHRKNRNKPGMLQQHKHFHAFAGLLRCRCGGYGTAKYDKPRKSGLRPSQYCCTIYLNGNRDLCQNHRAISDITLGPFIFDYLQNMVYIQRHAKKFPTPASLESRLLQGAPFVSVAGIDTEALQQLYDALNLNLTIEYADKDRQPMDKVPDPRDTLLAERTLHERAFERLKKAYLYDDIGISEKDFLRERQRITEQIERINKELQKLSAGKAAPATNDIEFLDQASNFLIKKQLTSTTPIDWQVFALHVDAENLQRFLRTIIDTIVFDDRRILSIKFKNGAVHRFTYK